MAATAQLKDQDDPQMLRLAHENGVLRIIMDRPPANALSLGMMEALIEAFTDAREDASVKVIILSSAAKLFCAGHDLKEMTAARKGPDKGRALFAETFALCSDLMQAIVRHPRPVIAEVDGIATAAGCQLVASCDLAVASTRAGFATPGVNIGLFCSTPMVALSRNVAGKHAMEMLLTGETIDAETAKGHGLVNRVVAPDALSAETMKLAELIASKSPLSVKTGKEAFYAQAEMSLAEAYDYTAKVMVENMLFRDAEEGIGAFIDKREPEWRGE